MYNTVKKRIGGKIIISRGSALYALENYDTFNRKTSCLTSRKQQASQILRESTDYSNKHPD